MAKKIIESNQACFCKMCTLTGLDHISSINSLYRPIRGKRRKLRLRKDPTVAEFQAIVQEKLEQVLYSIPNKKKKIRLSLGMKFYIKPSSMNRRDVTNMVKSVEDVISKVCGIDDRYVIDAYIRKYPSADETESIKIFLGVHQTDACYEKGNACPIQKRFRHWVH